MTAIYGLKYISLLSFWHFRLDFRFHFCFWTLSVGSPIKFLTFVGLSLYLQHIWALLSKSQPVLTFSAQTTLYRCHLLTNSLADYAITFGNGPINFGQCLSDCPYFYWLQCCDAKCHEFAVQNAQKRSWVIMKPPFPIFLYFRFDSRHFEIQSGLQSAILRCVIWPTSSSVTGKSVIHAVGIVSLSQAISKVMRTSEGDEVVAEACQVCFNYSWNNKTLTYC